jgi:uncharacterized protein YbjT (DUF2867 family)
MEMTTKKKITVVGATGNMGTLVARHLVQAGYQVKAVVRNLEKAKKSLGNENNIELVYGDLTDTDSLEKALKETEYLYLNLSTMTTDMQVPFANEREGVANILKAVNRERIRQILAISGLGAYKKDIVPEKYIFIPNLIRMQGHDMLRQSGIPYTILHCTWFIDSFLIYLRKGTYSIIGNNGHPIYFISASDYSRQLINAIGNSKAFNKDYPIQGKEGLPHKVAAEEFFRIYSPEIKVNAMPGALLSILALLNKQMKVVKAMERYFKHYKEEFMAEASGTFADLGEPQFTLKEYAKYLKAEDTR